MAEGHREAARHASLTATSTTAPSTQKADNPTSPFGRGFSPPLTDITERALDELLRVTSCYPYFLQEWGKQSWDAADTSPIDDSDVARATPTAIAALDRSFFRVRFDRLTPAEKRYLRAMADLGSDAVLSSAVADRLGRKASSFGPVRGTLIAKGMIYTPEYGRTAFTVPLFDAFMKRAMP